jgi:phosphatidylinositol alpha-1,6-mannosyltransferase
LGHLSPNDLPLAYASADVFAMCCRDRWFGLEQEGFGIVFLEAAACGLPQVAGRSGGSHEAVADGVTGVVVERPKDDGRVAEALEPLLVDQSLREKMGAAARQRVEQMFSYELLAESLAKALREAGE